MTSLALADDQRARLRAIHELTRAGRIVEAGEAASAALADGIRHPLTLSLAADRLERSGHDEEALMLLEEAAALAPDAPGIVNALGLCLQRLGRHAAAIDTFDRALAVTPAFVPALVNRGHSHLAQSALLRARDDFSAAIAHDPANLLAASGLAALAVRRGDNAAAAKLARAVLAREPGYPDAVLTLAQAEIALGDPVTAEERLTPLLEESPVAPHDQATALGLIGDARDRQGRFSAAFEAYSHSGERFAALGRARFADHPPQLLLRTITRDLTRRVEPVRPHALAPGPARRHVFLVGFPRSGTTLLEQVLEQHPDTVTMAEKEALAGATRIALPDAATFAAFCAAPPSDLEELRQDYWRNVRAEGADPGGRVFVDKHPFHSFKLPLIARLFPDATILIARRDPRDTVLSCFRRRFQLNAPTYQFLTLAGTADLFDATMGLLAATRRGFALDPLECRLEALVRDFEGTMRPLLDALGLRWTEGLDAFAGHVGERGVFTPSGPQLARGLNAEGIGRWRDYAEELAPVLPMLARWIDPA